MSEENTVPVVTDPNDVLIKVAAASVNPIDIAMAGLLYLKVYSLYKLSSCTSQKCERGTDLFNQYTHHSYILTWSIPGIVFLVLQVLSCSLMGLFFIFK